MSAERARAEAGFESDLFSHESLLPRTNLGGVNGGSEAPRSRSAASPTPAAGLEQFEALRSSALAAMAMREGSRGGSSYGGSHEVSREMSRGVSPPPLAGGVALAGYPV